MWPILFHAVVVLLFSVLARHSLSLDSVEPWLGLWPHRLFWGTILAAGLSVYYFGCIKPLDIIRDPEDVRRGGRSIGRRSTRQDASADVPRAAKVPGSLPPPYPNGWYRILDSWELPVGGVKHICVLGRHLALFRGEDGKAAVLDAYCPHLGANLGAGGRVVGNAIRCPFHGWTWGADGKAVSIPYCDEIPAFAKTVSWPCFEANNFVHVYFDAEGRPPSWTPPVFEQLRTGSWPRHGRTVNYINCHIQEIPENGADVAHLAPLHETFVLPSMSPGLSHGWAASWQPNPTVPHETVVPVKQFFKVFGRQIESSGVDVSIRQVGPGLVYHEFATPFGKVLTCESVTPLKPLFQQSVHHVYAEPSVPRFVAKFILWSVLTQFERDIWIWNDKTFLKKPMLVKGDGNILGFRRWYSQFYSESSDKQGGLEAALDW